MGLSFKLLFAILVGCAPVQTRHASAQKLGGRPLSQLDGGREALDRFGVREIYPTAPEGRQWYLPDSPAEFDAQWIPENRKIVSLSPGRYHTEGEVRLNVGSPAGAHWWRDVEMTAYLYDTGPVDAASLPDPTQKPHWELFARGERHTHRPVLGSEVNQGSRPPPGTDTWPGYPFGPGPILPECLGTAYHGNLYPDGRVQFEKEISHTAGYGKTRRAESHVQGFRDPRDRWFGLKFVAYNRSPTDVHLELWLDADADGHWVQVAETGDTGGWEARDPRMDGCGAPPFGFRTDQILTWAGPYVAFRADAIGFDFKWLSIREIHPPR